MQRIPVQVFNKSNDVHANYSCFNTHDIPVHVTRMTAHCYLFLFMFSLPIRLENILFCILLFFPPPPSLSKVPRCFRLLEHLFFFQQIFGHSRQPIFPSSILFLRSLLFRTTSRHYCVFQVDLHFI